jgi:hypothetical protein
MPRLLPLYSLEGGEGGGMTRGVKKRILSWILALNNKDNDVVFLAPDSMGL